MLFRSNSVLLLIVLNFTIEAIGKSHTAFQFVVLEEAVRGSHKYIQLAAIVNVSILLSVVGTWIGLSIAAMVQTWQFMRYLRRRNSGAIQPAQPRAA